MATTNTSATNALLNDPKKKKGFFSWGLEPGVPKVSMDAPKSTMNVFNQPTTPPKETMEQPKSSITSSLISPPSSPPKENMPEPESSLNVKTMTEEKKTPTAEGYQSALDIITKGLTGEGSKGTQAAILGGREALATATRAAEAQAGGLASSTGAIGQGTAGGLAVQVRNNALKSLAEQETSFVQLKSAEQKDMIDRIISAEQSERSSSLQEERLQLEERGLNLNEEQMNRQFDHLDETLKEQIASRMQSGEQFNLQRLDQIDQFTKTMDLTKQQWEIEFGARQGNQYINNLLELSIDNPTLAAKVTSYMLNGQTGSVGDFTPEEKAQLNELADKARIRDDKIDNVFDLTINKLQTDLLGFSGYTGSGTGAVDQILQKPFESLSDQEFETNLNNKSWFDYQVQQGNIPDLREAAFLNEDNIKSLFEEGGSRGIMSLNGVRVDVVKSFNLDGVNTIVSSPDLKKGTKTAMVVIKDDSGNEVAQADLILSGSHAGEIYDPYTRTFNKIGDFNSIEDWKEYQKQIEALV